MSEAGILSGHEIWRNIEAGAIRIEPGVNEAHINPASYDLTLGPKVAVYVNSVTFGHLGERYPSPTATHPDWDMKPAVKERSILDSRKPNSVHVFDMHPVHGWLLKPGIGYLMHTAERIWTKMYVPVLDGKSSLGRLFMTAHVTAGYGDPGFDGQYTLEVVVTHPVIVYPGMRFCQIRFHTLVGRTEGYERKGHYVGTAAEGPVPSLSWKQFEEKGS